MTRPSPHRCQIWHQSPRGPWVQVVPAPVTAEAALEVGDRLYPLLKLGVLCLNTMLKVDVEQLTGVVPPMLGLIKSTVSDQQLTVLL
jgi:hypothetical protein